ncbi:hypothetical protein O988_04514 [Pseudogymnoascus sp. VKM F-3808]|nr:hypothetical protein O988_04514 [Pseudogymnoascus sp. VKM F-3808]
MDTILYVILAAVVFIILKGTVFADRSPIPETSGNVNKVAASAELDGLLKSTTYVIVDFYADWCPPCRAIAPVFSKLADEHAVKGKLAFAKVNVDHVKDVAGKYGITAMPTFLFFKDGKVTSEGGVERIRGANVGELRAVVGRLAGKV